MSQTPVPSPSTALHPSTGSVSSETVTSETVTPPNSSENESSGSASLGSVSNAGASTTDASAAEAAGTFNRFEYWRSVEELVDPELRSRLAAEFPEGSDTPPDAVSRRHFLSLLGATAALGGAGGCMQQPRERILPYTYVPESVIPGIPLHYASTLTRDGMAVGVIVTAREGRPIKIDGNPEHPASLGASGPIEQAQLLQLYDPDRSQGVTHNTFPRSWRNFYDTFAPQSLRSSQPQSDGTGLHFLLEPTTSLVVEDLVRRVRERLPRARFHPWSSSILRNENDGLQAITGERIMSRPDLSRASVIVSLDDDFLGPHHPNFLRLSRQFADGRRVNEPNARMNRLYVVETAMTVTGMSADHRFPTRAGDVANVAVQLLAELASLPPSGMSQSPVPQEARAALSRRRAPEAQRGWLAAVAKDLAANRGRSLVTVGSRQPAAVHAVAHLLNAALGNVGSTVEYGPVPYVSVDSGGVEAFLSALRGDEVQTAIIVGGNPVYSAPPEFGLAGLLSRVPQTVYFGDYRNETAAACRWFLPRAHPLESWGDARAFDGTLSLSQPLIAPLYDGRTLPEFLAGFAGERGMTGHQLLSRLLEERFGLSSTSLEQAIQRGIVDGQTLPPTQVQTNWGAVESVIRQVRAEEPNGIELAIALDYKVADGAFGNLSWLQELPDPVTKLTWDNALLLSPATARRLSVQSEDVVELSSGEHSVNVPVLVVPGHADEAATLHLGYGRSAESEAVARGIGVNAFVLIPADGKRFGPATVRRLGTRHKLAVTQLHWSMEGRPIALSAEAESYRDNPGQFHLHGPLPSLYEPFVHEGVQWAMAIDLNACTGCSACVVACQAENNIPVVGKHDVLRSREMHWLRIDRYFSGDPGNPRVVTQPMLCQHCEKAPCEYVCPVNATTHSPDGINEMTYNRCVGTRFCSNNCPYKVRRFNWFDYTGRTPPVVQLAMNPEVTVRQRGVMEKCTFCVQRVRNAEITAEVQRRPLREGDVVTACQQACPTRAIDFGSLSDPDSVVSKRAKNPRAYSVLEELGTRPRVRYLARITNPNPELS